MDKCIAATSYDSTCGEFIRVLKPSSGALEVGQAEGQCFKNKPPSVMCGLGWAVTSDDTAADDVHDAVDAAADAAGRSSCLDL